VRALALRSPLGGYHVSVAIITVVNRLGVQLQTTFNTASTQLGTAGK
jgi:Flp pilus assembly pilin Flp